MLNKQHTIEELRKEIFAMQGMSAASNNKTADILLGPIKNAFPNAQFPTAAIHEFLLDSAEAACTKGFISVLVTALLQSGSRAIWLSTTPSIFPPALAAFGLQPQNILFIYLANDKQISWALEEALKCIGLCAVIAEVKDISFTTSRRLQLAVEKSKVTGFILRQNNPLLNTSACVSRFKITSMASSLPHQMPGVGHPRWQVELLKVRNGKPGKWQVEFAAGSFRFLSNALTVAMQQKRKAV